MKKLSIILSVLLCLIMGSTVKAARMGDGWYDFSDEGGGLYVVARLYGDTGGKTKPIVMDTAELTDAMKSECREYERAFAWTMEFEDASIEFPETRIGVKVDRTLTIVGGDGKSLLGKDYRLFYVENDTLTPVGMEEENESFVDFTTEKTGTYVLYYDPRVYRQTYYTEDTEDEYGLPASEIYYQSEYMKDRDLIDYPKTLPQKDGHIFIGWAYKRAYPEVLVVLGPMPNLARSYWDIFAKWCPEDEYIPFNAEITTESDIVKGKENGSVITVKLTNGKFSDFMEGIPEEDEEEREIRMSLWRERWQLVGVDGVSVERVDFVDDKTINLILKGNSSDKYSSSEVYLEFKQSLVKDITTQIDEKGFFRDMLRSDNAIKFKAQTQPSGGGGGGTSSNCTVKFDYGTNTASQSVKRGSTVTEPSAPTRDGYVFGGWYTDKECTKKYSFGKTVSKGFTLYAKWDKADPEPIQPEKTNTIVLTVGKTDANVFGSGVKNDVAPVIKNDTTMLPSRFVAESLGAKVEWLGGEQKVVITKDDMKIEILIGSDTAYVNGEAVKLLQPAFVENDRTFTPIRFISEQLGADVDWNSETGEVTITKK